ncbi:TniB family NTP-binding protein [Acidimangrovimonas pyrenivorans]|uniref:TniB family NTP-binding protein n=1 Tax=Acidimangrovimonas pyrenivorans TaxID=2030798 RepID=A0ABV7ALV8_9RHOB
MTITLNPSKVVQELRGFHVETERDRDFRKQLNRILIVEDDGTGNPSCVPAKYTADLETRGVLVIEPSGGGKTTAIRRVLEGTAALGINPDTQMPRYLQIQVPSPATLKSVGLAILDATGMSGVKEKTPVWEIWDMVRHRLKLLGIVVLWLDEAQDLILAKSIQETENAIRMLKSIMQGENGVVLVLSGTQQLAQMANLDPQVSRRFTKIVPRALEMGADEEGLESLIGSYCEAAGLAPKVSDDLASRLIRGSRQRFGRAVETIVNAIECALLDEDSSLTDAHFSEAWAMQEGCEIVDNIFDTPDWLSVPLDVAAEEFEDARVRRQKKKLEKA